MSLPILRSHTRDPRPWLEPDGTRHRSWVWHDARPAGRDIVGAYAFRDAEQVPHIHPASRVLGIVRETWDAGDPFGSAMAGLGAICDVLAGCGVWGVIPQGWGYWPAGGGRPSLAYDPDSGEGYLAAGICEALGIDPAEPTEPATDEIRELLHAGAVLDRLVTQCRLTGCDY